MDAEFIGLQEDGEGGKFPLFNITKENHPQKDSTVTLEDLMRLGLKYAPHFERYHDHLPQFIEEQTCPNPDCAMVWEVCVCGQEISAQGRGCRQCSGESKILFDEP